MNTPIFSHSNVFFTSPCTIIIPHAKTSRNYNPTFLQFVS